jgi:hypothetical protein
MKPGLNSHGKKFTGKAHFGQQDFRIRQERAAKKCGQADKLIAAKAQRKFYISSDFGAA